MESWTAGAEHPVRCPEIGLGVVASAAAAFGVCLVRVPAAASRIESALETAIAVAGTEGSQVAAGVETAESGGWQSSRRMAVPVIAAVIAAAAAGVGSKHTEPAPEVDTGSCHIGAIAAADKDRLLKD